MLNTWFLKVIIFIIGTVIGSFLNVVVDRLDTERSAFKGRSFCPYCGKTLSWWEMVPVLNYFYLKGRCSSCHHKLPLQYPIIEFLTGILFLSAYLRFLRYPLLSNLLLSTNFSERLFLVLILGLWFYWIFVVVSLTLYDIKKYLIPLEILFPAIIISLIFKLGLGFLFRLRNFFILEQINLLLGANSYVFGQYNYFLSLIVGIIIGFSILAALAFLTNEKAMGWGDALFGILMGIILGYPSIVIALIISFLTGGFISLALIIIQKKTIKSYLPFVPFLSFGTLAVLLFGDIIIKWYLALLII